ncbi:retrotransposon protein, putative, ty1-copia subclass, partial [Tanacetum coccineum]
MVNDNMDMIVMVFDVIAMISEVNLVGAVDNVEKVYTGNSVTADIKGEGDVILNMTSEKELKLTNVLHQFTAPYSPQQNGIAERKNHTLKEMVNAMLISSGLSQDMWGESILTTTYLLNKIPRKEKEETPYELWMGRKPSYQYLRVWGCLAKKQRDDNDLQDERLDQAEEEEIEPRRSKRERTEKSFGPDFVSFMVENEPTLYRYT